MLLTLGLELVGVEFLNAEVLVLDVVILLSQKLGDHIIDGLLGAEISIELHLDDKRECVLLIGPDVGLLVVSITYYGSVNAMRRPQLFPLESVLVHLHLQLVDLVL